MGHSVPRVKGCFSEMFSKLPGAQTWEDEDGRSVRTIRLRSFSGSEDLFGDVDARVAGCCRARPLRVTAVSGNNTPPGPPFPSWFRKGAAERAERADRSGSSVRRRAERRGRARAKRFVPWLIPAPRDSGQARSPGGARVAGTCAGRARGGGSARRRRRRGAQSSCAQQRRRPPRAPRHKGWCGSRWRGGKRKAKASAGPGPE